MRKMLFVCDKCGKVISKDPISVVPMVLNEDGNFSACTQSEKYASLKNLQFCEECMNKIAECFTGNLDNCAKCCSDFAEMAKAEPYAAFDAKPVVEKEREYPTLDDLMKKYADSTNSNTSEVVETSSTQVSSKNPDRKNELISRLSDCVLNMEISDVADVAQTYIDEGYPAFDGIMDGLVDGMNKASALYDAEEYFVTDVLLCSDAMYAGLNVLRPHLATAKSNEVKHKVVIGVVEGDTHDIGKNLVKIMLDTAGFEVYDLGRDVPADAFVNKAMEVGASIICMSTLMTTTMDGMRVVIDKLKKKGVRDRFKIMVGGSPLSKKFADEIGADGYTANAVDAVKQAKQFVGMEDVSVVLGR